MNTVSKEDITKIYQLYVVLIEDIPGYKDIKELIDIRQSGESLTDISKRLIDRSKYSYELIKTSNDFAVNLINSLLDYEDHSVKMIVYNWINADIKEKGRENKILDIINSIVLNQYGIVSSTKKVLANQVDIARYYTEEKQVYNKSNWTKKIFNSVEKDAESLYSAKLQINEQLKILSITLQDIIKLSPYEIPASYYLSNSKINLGERSIDNLSAVLSQLDKIINNSLNDSRKFEITYSVVDKIKNLTSKEAEQIIKKSLDYKVNEAAGWLGFLDKKEYKIVANAINSNQFQYIDLSKELSKAESYLKNYNLTISGAKSFLVENFNNIDKTTSILKDHTVTTGMIAAILSSSSSDKDLPIHLSVDEIQNLYRGYISDVYLDGNLKSYEGTSRSEFIVGSRQTSEKISGSGGQDSVIYDGQITDYKMKKLYAGKNSDVNGYSISSTTLNLEEDIIVSDVEFIYFREMNARIPTAGVLTLGSNSSDEIIGNELDDVIFSLGGRDVISGGGGSDTVVLQETLSNYKIEKLYKGKNGSFSGYLISDKNNNINSYELSKDIEYLSFSDQVIDLEKYQPDTNPPVLTISTDSKHLRVNEIIEIKFEFNEPVVGFDKNDLIVSGGELLNFSGFNKNYTATYKNLNSSSLGRIIVSKNTLTDKYDNKLDGNYYIEFLQDLHINIDGNTSRIKGGNGDDTFVFKGSSNVDGGKGLDEIFLNMNRINEDIDISGNEIYFRSDYAKQTHSLTSIERLHFKDISLAIDVTDFSKAFNPDMNAGNAGVVARILYGVLGFDQVKNPGLMGIGLYHLETLGKTPSELVDIAAKAVLGLDYKFDDLLKVFLKNTKPDLDISNSEVFAAQEDNYVNKDYLLDSIVYDHIYTKLIGIESFEFFPQ